MSVAIIWSTTNGGDAISESLDHGGDAAPGSTLDSQTIYLRHDGDNVIFNCKLYVSVASSYEGSFSAATDKNEILAWGDGITEASFGGFQINMNATGGFPVGSWPTYTTKQPSGGSAFYTGVGDSVDNGIILSTLTGLDSTGIVPAGDSPNVRFACRIAVPSDEDTSGVRHFSTKLRYSYTS